MQRKNYLNKYNVFKRNHGLISLALLLFVFLCGYAPVAYVDTAPLQMFTYLTQEHNVLIKLLHDEDNRLVPNTDISIKEEKHQLVVQRQLMKSKIQTFEQFLLNEQKNQQSLQREYKKTQRLQSNSNAGLSTKEQLSFIQEQRVLNEKVILLLHDDLKLARECERLLDTRIQALLVREATAEEVEQIKSAKQRITALEASRALLYEKNSARYTTDASISLEDEARVFLTNQDILLVGLDILHEQLRIKRIKADFEFAENSEIKVIESVTKVYQQLIREVFDLNQRLEAMRGLVKSQLNHVADSSVRHLFFELDKKINLRIDHLKKDSTYLIYGLEKKQHALKKQLSSRQTLAEYHMNIWPDIFNQILQIPSQCYLYVKSLVIKIMDYSSWHDGLFLFTICVSLSVILAGAIALATILRRITQNKIRSRLSAHLLDGLLVLIHQNIPQVTVIAMGSMVLMLNQVSYSSCQLLIHLTIIWMIYRQLVLIARLTLLERLDDFSGHDVSLYYRLKWLLLSGAWSTTLMVMSYELPLSYVLQEIFNWLFMSFLFVFSLVLWKSRDAITYVLPPPWRNREGYVRHVVSLIGVLLPITLLTTSLIGFVGYINLAWTMSRYQAYGLLFITSYVLVRGLLRDLLYSVSEWMVAVLHNGWLWVEVFLKPIDKLLRISLFVLSVYVLLVLLGYSSDPKLKSNLVLVLYYPLINVSGVHVTLMSLSEFFALLFLFIWVAKWTRECCYRWLYRDVIDLGIRNSLSVFTQYAIILLGFFITVRVLGVDFTGMAVVLGGLAVGMGFGLRDFASNIVGGLMLLIERPVREGDLITIGDYEGKVAHIGIRSMRVSSWDNMEVLIPNAETFNKPFSNWTHQDSIVRTVVPIKISRVDDPVAVQQLIFDVLEIIPEVLKEPAAQVFLKQIDDTLIEFEIRYFINVQLYTRFEIRSKVLFAIMAQFNAAGVKHPVPALHVELDKS